MADALATAASGIAVVSLAIQLAESVKKLCDFWTSIKEAPEDIQAISTDLDLLSGVLTRIAYETQHVEPDATLVATLNGCWAKVRKLTVLLNGIEPGFASRSLRVRKWTALRAVLKHGQLMKFQAALESLKGTLLLVQQYQYSRLSRNRHISLERSLMTITQGVSSLSMQHHSGMAGTVSSAVLAVQSDGAAYRAEKRDATKLLAGNLQPIQSDHSVPGGSWRQQPWVKRTLRVEKSVMEYFLATLRAESNTKLQTSRETDGLTPSGEQDRYEHETSYTVCPAPWLIRLGLQYGFRLKFHSSTQGWKTALKAFCPVPDDALIFEFCKQGNVPAVRSLLSGGHASVRDTDSRGYTPLHFAAQNYHSELCKMLQGAGADISALTHDAETPMVLAAEESENTTYATLSEVFDTLRLLNDSMDFLDKDGDGWQILWTLCRNTYSLGEERQATIALLIRMLRLSSFDLKTYFVRERVTKMLNYTLRPDPGLEEASNLLLNLGGAEIIDTALWSSDGYTILHETVALAIEGQISTVLARGPDLHPLGFDYDYTPQEESPTSLAMYSSWAFMDWLRGLVTIEVDFEEFLNQELERNSLVHAGWEKETLRALFAYRHRPDLNFRKVWTCSDCSEVYCRVTVQPYWRHLLERIKQRIDPDSPAQADSQDGERDNADVRSIAEAASSSNDLAHEPDTTGHDGVSSESESEPELEDSHGYPAMISIRSDCVYPPHEVICVDCWLHYLKTGTPRPPHPGKRRFTGLYKTDSSIYNHSSSGDEVSEDEYSPYLIHS